MKDNAQLIVSEVDLMEYVTESICYPTAIVIGFVKGDKEIVSISTVEHAENMAKSILDLCGKIKERYGHNA